MPSLTDAFQNLYTYIISIAGVIALFALIRGGILYLTSTGNSEKLAKAKKQILAALFGIVILLSSYLILRTINPELVEFNIPELEPIPEHPLDAPPKETKVPTLLERVREIAEDINTKIIPGFKNSAQEIQQLTNECSCSRSESLCMCSGGEDGDSCEGKGCFAGPGSHPCSSFREIKENQKRVIAWKDELFYYRNRAIAEEQELQDEIKKVLDEKIVYYQKNIEIEEDEEIIEYFKQEKEKITKEKNLKKDLEAKLKELSDLIEKTNAPASKLSQLPDECLTNVKDKCQASCMGDCHDTYTGCQQLACFGGNPCPTDEIQNQFDEIRNLASQISQVCDEILNIIDEIIKHKTIII